MLEEDKEDFVDNGEVDDEEEFFFVSSFLSFFAILCVAGEELSFFDVRFLMNELLVSSDLSWLEFVEEDLFVQL